MNRTAAQPAVLQVPFLRALILALAALIASSALLLGAAPASQAAPAVPVSTSSAINVSAAMPINVHAASSVCSVGGGVGARGADKSLLLPVNRWAESTTKMHSLMESQEHVSNAMNGITRQGIVANGLGGGNAMWAITSGLVTLSADMCPLNDFGGAMDSVAAMLGDAVIGSPLITIIVVILIIGVAWSFARRGGVRNVGGIVSKLAAVAVLAVMVMGAQASTGAMAFNSSNSDDPYKPGVMSPGWVVTTINNAVGSIASVPAQDLVINDSFKSDSKSWTENLSCSRYMGIMKDGYTSLYHSDLNKMSAGLPMTISTLWETTALQAWRTAQFGPTIDADSVGQIHNLPLDDSSWCRMLEWNADVPLEAASRNTFDASVESLMIRSMAPGTFPHAALDSMAFKPVSDRDYDRSAIAWAACDITKGARSGVDGSGNGDPDQFIVDWRFASHDYLEGRSLPDGLRVPANNGKDAKDIFIGVAGVAGGADGAGAPSPEDCAKWWTDSEEENSAFAWPTTNKEVAEKAPDNEQVQTFLNTLHGTDNTASVPAMIAYIVASLVILLSFGLMAVGLVIAKFAMALLVVGIFISIIMVLMPGGSWSKVAGVLKVLLGVMIYAWCIQFLMSLIAFIAKLLTQLGNGMFELGSTFHIFWVGLSPAMAVLLLHMLFTKGLKMASPFSINGALAWGQKIGGASASALSGLSSMAGAGRAVRDRARGMGRRGGAQEDGPNGNPIQGKNNGVIGGGVGTPTTRRGQLDPKAYGAGGAGGGTGGSGGSAGDGVETGSEGVGAPQGDREPALVGAGAAAEASGRSNASMSTNAGLLAATSQVAAPVTGGGLSSDLDDDQVESVPTGEADVAPQVGGQDPGAHEQPAGNEESSTEGATQTEGARAGFDPDMLVTSTVSNSKLGKGGMSQVGDGRMSADERKNLRATAKAERGLASEWDNNRRQAMGLKERSDSKIGRFWEHRAANVQAGLHNARRNFAANPVGSVIGGAKSATRHAGKGALIGAGVLTAGAFAPAMVPLALAGLGARQVYKMKRKDKNVDRARMDSVVTDYRNQRAKELKGTGQRAKQNPQPAPATTNRNGNPGGQVPGGNGGTSLAPSSPQGPMAPTGGQAPVASPASGAGPRNAIADGYRYATGTGPTVNQDILAASSVPNSQLGAGKASQFGNGSATFWEKRKVNMLAGQERKRALQFENQQRAAQGIAPLQGPSNRDALRATANRAGQRITQVGQDLRSRDANAIFNHAARASGSMAKGYVTGSAAVAAASLLGPAGLPVAAAALGGAALVKSRRRFSAERAGEMDQIVNRYRAHHRQSAGQAGLQSTGSPQVSGQQRESIQSVPAGPGGESSIKPAGPITEQIPVVPGPSAPATGPQGVPPVSGRRSAGAPRPGNVEQAQAGADQDDPNKLVVVGDYTGLSYDQAMAKIRADGLLPSTKAR
ncbi:type IV secretion system protein (plasmid) [Citricoccus nitrophenolicus]